jgi:hypothetical protein
MRKLLQGMKIIDPSNIDPNLEGIDCGEISLKNIEVLNSKLES